jgi:hypothetical protein
VYLDGSDEPSRKKKECGDQLEGAADDKADEPEGQKDEPDDRIEKESREGQGPADHEENAEQQEFEHQIASSRRYGGCGKKFRGG